MKNEFSQRVGVLENEMNELIAPEKKESPAAIGLIGIGLEMHFDWEKANECYQLALNSAAYAITERSRLLHQDKPIQTKKELLTLLNNYKSEGMEGLVIYQASFIAGELALALATWLQKNAMPLLCWSHTEVTGGNLTANRFCGQNFLVNVLSSMQVPYSWVFGSPDSEELHQSINRFSRVICAKSRMLQGKLLMVGGMRVPGFYDCELNEISLARHFGVEVERLDLETIWDYGKEKFPDSQVSPLVNILINSSQCSFNEVSSKELHLSIRLALAVADFVRAGDYLGVSLKNWPELFERYGIAGDGAGALVQDLGIPVADESDMGGLLTMVTINELTEKSATPTLLDMSHIDVENNLCGLWHCGGSASKLLKHNEKFQIRNHSILDNFDKETSCGMLFEFLQEVGPVTIAKYQYPHASKIMMFEGDIVASEMRYRGCYGEVKPKDIETKSIINTVLSNGLDHHWILGRGHFIEDLREFNHWVNVHEVEIMAEATVGRSQVKNMNY